MKSRILKTLLSLSNHPSKERHIVINLCDTLNISEKELSSRSNQMLKIILLEYASFDVLTLDKFNHRLVRAFAREFKLPYGFEIVIDPSDLLDETVNSIIDTVGKDVIISKLLLDFSINKVLNDKDWDIQKDLNDFIRLLLNENDRRPVNNIKNKNFKALQADKKLLEIELSKTKKAAIKYAENALSFLTEKGLEPSDFTRSQLHKHFQDVHKQSFYNLYDNQIEASLSGEKPLYNKTLSKGKKSMIEEILPQIQYFFFKIKNYIGYYLVIERTLKSWTPRMLLQKMENQLDVLQNEKKVRLLGEFNSKISRLVRYQPAPFIYERLGGRYQHFFLDEFQDTSELQWENLIPLLANSLESQNFSGFNGSLLLVGDPKQAIYRWRGGNMEQYIDLINKVKNPFHVEAELFSLNKNFRSGEEIVSFNNDFFLFLSKYFDKLKYQNMYGKKSQQKAQNKGGYVRIETILNGVKDITTPLYISKTLTFVSKIISQGYLEGDIAILVRKKEQGEEIGKALGKANYNFISSDSVIVSKSIKVQLFITFLKLSLNPSRIEYHKSILDILWEIWEKEDEKYHEFALKNLHLKTPSFLKALEVYFDFTFKMEYLQNQSVFDAVNYILLCFPQIDPKDAYVHFFIEDVHEFSKTNTPSVQSYLRYWKLNSEKLSIAMPEGLEAIKLMTIHQAKGLEFPIVILPFMDTSIYPSITEKIWYPFREGKLENIKWGWFNFSKELRHFGSEGLKLYNKYRLNQQLDAFNVLYVALTRSIEGLFIITQEVNKGDKTYSHWFKNYLESQGKTLNILNAFELGVLPLKKQIKSNNINHESKKWDFNLPLNSSWKKRLILDSHGKDETRDARDWGVLVHDLLSKITSVDLIPEVIQKALKDEILLERDKESVEEKLLDLVKHPKLSRFFDGTELALCEKDILIPNRPILRPDRINFSNNGKISVLDYKTGNPKKGDIEQIKKYGMVLQDLGYDKIDNYLVYINNKIKVIKID